MTFVKLNAVKKGLELLLDPLSALNAQITLVPSIAVYTSDRDMSPPHRRRGE